MIQEYDADYSPEFNKQLGLDTQGRPPTGATFVSRSMPAGTTLRSYQDTTAEVSVWCSTLFGHTAENATDPIPVKTGWITMRVTLRWTDKGWRMTDFQQTDGPEPTDAEFGTAPQL